MQVYDTIGFFTSDKSMYNCKKSWYNKPMSKMKEILLDIEELLLAGHDPDWIAQFLDVRIELVHDIEEECMQLGNPYFYGPDSE